MRRVAMTVGIVVLGLGATVRAQEVAKAQRMAVLDVSKGHWRRWVTYATPVVMEKDGSIRRLKKQKERAAWMSGEWPKAGLEPVIESARPSSSWMGVDFDDSQWVVGHGPLGPRYHKRKNLWNLREALAVFARGRFQVDDPAKVRDLKLSLTYRGGIVVHLNGKEIGRGHMPKGALSLDTPAEAYPDEVYVDSSGKPIQGVMHRRTPEKLKAVYRKRDRRLDLDVPAGALRRGVNVLAISVHRAPPKTVWSWQAKIRGGAMYTRWPLPWGHARLLSGTLSSAPGSALSPNMERPKGIQVWATHGTVCKTRLSPDTWTDPLEPRRPIAITGCRNGTFCGRVVVSSPAAITNLSATLTELRGPGGAIPPKNVTRFFPLPDDRAYRSPSAFGSLLTEAPQTVPVSKQAQAAIQPVWIKVKVPANAKAGVYRGDLQVSWDGKEKQTVPVSLTVHDWRMPDPSQFHIFVDMIQSPETVAIRYKVEQWSEPHWKQLEKCLRLFGECGNKTTYLKLITKTHFGNTQSILRFVKEGNGWKRDYSILDRYMDLVERCQGKPELVILYCWERYTAHDKAPRVTRLDPKTGSLSEMETPAYCTPEGKAFWKPVFAELRERFRKRGLEDALVIGAFGDFNKPQKKHVEFFKEVAPGLQWVSQGHPFISKVHGVPCRYATTVWNATRPPDPAKARSYGWQGKRGERVAAQFARDIWRTPHLAIYSTLLEFNMAAGRRGAGRIGGDFWNVLGRDQKPNQRGGYSGGARLAHRFPEMGKWGQLVVRQNMINPGPDGAVPSVKFEALRANAQDCEARMFIERALLSKQLPKELAARARATLDERTRFLIGWGPYQMGYTRRQTELYGTAAAVKAALQPASRD